MGLKSDTFQSFIADQLDSIPAVRFRKMFGGFGIYSNERFFGIIHSEKLFFHTNAATKPRFEAAGMGCFITPGRGKPLKNYREVPVSTLERKTEIIEWALESIDTVE